MPTSQQEPLTQADFDGLRRNKAWQIREVYLDTLEAALDPLAENIPWGPGKIQYLIKRTGRSDFPYLRYGPFEGEASKSPWPSKKDVSAYFEQNKAQPIFEGRRGKSQSATARVFGVGFPAAAI
jgi:hypothetical protein